MSEVRIITDITAHLEPNLIAQYNITVLPVEIRFGDQKFNIDSAQSAQRLYRKMAEGPAKPAQATISSDTLYEAYDRLSRETGEILVIPSSSKLSKGFDRAPRRLSVPT